MADAGLKVWLDGKEYDFDDFEIGELEWLEDELGVLDDVTLTSMKALVRFAYLIKKRENPDYTLDEARKLKQTAFDRPRPTRAARAKTPPAA